MMLPCPAWGGDDSDDSALYTRPVMIAGTSRSGHTDRSSNDLSDGLAAHCSLYQSECRDHWRHERQAVIVQWCRQDGQTPPVSKVFHMWPQLQNQRSPAVGDQLHFGQRMRGPVGPRSDVSRVSISAGAVTVGTSRLYATARPCLSDHQLARK